MDAILQMDSSTLFLVMFFVYAVGHIAYTVAKDE